MSSVFLSFKIVSIYLSFKSKEMIKCSQNIKHNYKFELQQHRMRIRYSNNFGVNIEFAHWLKLQIVNLETG